MTGRYGFFWKGVKHNIPLCCVLFFDTVWDGWTQRRERELKEYGDRMNVVTSNAGVILCPQCLHDAMKVRAVRVRATADRKVGSA